jgi:hypothetical protein
MHSTIRKGVYFTTLIYPATLSTNAVANKQHRPDKCQRNAVVKLKPLIKQHRPDVKSATRTAHFNPTSVVIESECEQEERHHFVCMFNLALELV